jgi:hypothetical protein
VLESDHQPLKWILTNSKLIDKMARWALMLSEFDFEVKHRAGVDNEMDCLSRYPHTVTRTAREYGRRGAGRGGRSDLVGVSVSVLAAADLARRDGRSCGGSACPGGCVGQRGLAGGVEGKWLPAR